MKKSWPFVLSALFLATTGCATQQAGQDQPSTALVTPEHSSRIATRAVQKRAVAEQREEAPCLIERLRNGLAFTDGRNTDLFSERLDWHRSNPTFLPELLGRGERYLHYIVEELEAAGLPAELAMIPIVESGFDPFAYSPSHASGMWQFIPATGERFGLTRDWWWAGRRDVIDSTAAALAYLEYLHDFFDGDWLLALAAYNAGEGTVSRAVARNRAANQPTDFWSLQLPQQTQNYIPAILALAEVLREPETYGVALPEMPNEPYFEVVELEGAINLQTAADLAGVDKDELVQLNPAVRRGTLSPEGPHRLLVPVRNRDLFLDSLASVPQSEWMPAAFHTVERGDTLSGIAARYRVSVASLQRMNSLSGSAIRAGQRLQIPSGASTALNTAIAEASQPQQHVIRQGESLWSIARRHNISVEDLARWNQLDRNATLQPGQSLMVSGAAGNTAVGPERRQLSYRIQQGDSLYRIAQQFNLQVQDIMRWNQLDGNSVLRPGQGLVLYVN